MKSLKTIGLVFVVSLLFMGYRVLAAPDYEHLNFVNIKLQPMQKVYYSQEMNKYDYGYQYVEGKSYGHELDARVQGPSLVGGTVYSSKWVLVPDNWDHFVQLGNCSGNQVGAGCAPGKVKINFRQHNWQLNSWSFNAGWYMDEAMYLYHIGITG